jgi:hypothetical protein
MLEGLASHYPAPAYIRADNGPEFVELPHDPNHTLSATLWR